MDRQLSKTILFKQYLTHSVPPPSITKSLKRAPFRTWGFLDYSVWAQSSQREVQWGWLAFFTVHHLDWAIQLEEETCHAKETEIHIIQSGILTCFWLPSNHPVKGYLYLCTVTKAMFFFTHFEDWNNRLPGWMLYYDLHWVCSNN